MRAMHVRPCARIEDATVLATGHREMIERTRHRGFETLTRRAQLYRTWGDCHGYFQVATGGADVMLDPVVKPWDILALVPVIEGAGGRVTSLEGGDPLQACDLLASGGGLHDEVLEPLARRQAAD